MGFGHFSGMFILYPWFGCYGFNVVQLDESTVNMADYL